MSPWQDSVIFQNKVCTGGIHSIRTSWQGLRSRRGRRSASGMIFRCFRRVNAMRRGDSALVINHIKVTSLGSKPAKILFGKGRAVFVFGQWFDIDFRVGMQVVVIPCYCCMIEGKSYSSASRLCGHRSQETNSGCVLHKNSCENIGEKKPEKQKSRIVNNANPSDEKGTKGSMYSHSQLGDESISQQSNHKEELSSLRSNGMDEYYRAIENERFSFERDDMVVYIVDDNTNYILIEDDLLPVTGFCNALECINNPFIQRRIANFSFEYGHPSLVLGSVIHEIMQSCLILQTSDGKVIVQEAKRIIKNRILSCYVCNISDKEVLSQICKIIHQIRQFLSNGYNIKAVEHSVFSRTFGLKGSIDCLDRNFLFEIKTGEKDRVEHRAQTILYALLYLEQSCMNEKRLSGRLRLSHSLSSNNCIGICSPEREVDTTSKDKPSQNPPSQSIKKTKRESSGIYGNIKPAIYYVRRQSLVSVDFKHSEIVGLLVLRNKVAANTQISPCNCPENALCAVYNKIKTLSPSHFLRIQLEAIEYEFDSSGTLVQARVFEIKEENGKTKISVNTKEPLISDGHVSIVSKNFKFITRAFILLVSKDTVVLETFDKFYIDGIVYIKTDDNSNSLGFMLWSLFNVAYPIYLARNTLLRLPGSEYGLDVPDEVKQNNSFKTQSDHDPKSSLRETNSSAIVNDDIFSECLSESKTPQCNEIKRGSDFSFDFTSSDLINNSPKSKFERDLFGSTESSVSEFTIEERDIESMEMEDSAQGESAIKDKRGTININSNCDIKNTKDGTNLNLKGENQTNLQAKPSSNFTIGTNCEFQAKNSSFETHTPQNIEKHENSSLNTNKGLSKGDAEVTSKTIQVEDSSKIYLSHTVHSSVIPSLNPIDCKQKPKIAFNHIESTDSFQYFTPPVKHIKTPYLFSIPEIFMPDFVKLNEEQQVALFSALNCCSFKIIHGMPGTGKTTVISLLIKILIFYKKKVLLICFTHMAIDNIIKRLGSTKYYRAKKDTCTFETCKEVKDYFDGIDLVAGSCYSFDDPIYVGRKFDFCIIDEGSQMHLLLSLIPISISSRFCIVGDHLQLKPLSKKSKDLSVSLFEHLLAECTVLNKQYRMADDIMRLSNVLFYDNMLVGCGKNGTVEFIESSSINYNLFLESLKDCVVLCYFNKTVKDVQEHTSCVVSTIDRFQGSEHDQVVVLFDPVKNCEVMKSKERLNVALTRAKTKLTLVGNKEEMITVPILSKLIEVLKV